MKLEPIILTDKTRLQEVYDLRVDAWENSPESQKVNRQLFPNGWFDVLDEIGLHWVIFNDQNKIIAAARLNIFDNLQEFPYLKFIKNINIPNTTPFAFYSRLVVAPSYQGNSISTNLDLSILDFCKMKNVTWIIGLSSHRTELMVKKFGFKNFGITRINYGKLSDTHEVNIIIKIN